MPELPRETDEVTACPTLTEPKERLLGAALSVPVLVIFVDPVLNVAPPQPDKSESSKPIDIGKKKFLP